MTARPPSEGTERFPLRFILALGLMGFTALVAQVALTRELLALFLGNELSIALVLAVWLVAVALGSAIGARLAARFRAPLRAFAWSQMLLACVLPAALVAARWLQPGGLTPGQVLGPGAMLLTSVWALAPVCLVGGFQFVLGARAAAAGGRSGDQREGHEIARIAIVYALEAAGAVLGGVVFHLYLAQHVGPIRTLSAVGLLNVISACALLQPRWSRGAARALAPAALIAGALLALAVRGDSLEIVSLRISPRWSDLNPVAFVPSKYGALVVSDQGGQVSLFQSGVLLFTSEDDYANEVVAHLTLLEHPRPRRVLLIGGGVAGLAGEALKHPIAELDCVELDPRVVDLARRWLPPELTEPLSSPRVRVQLGDGRLFVRRAEAAYDVIIVNLPDPSTGAINRFYTREFLTEAYRALAPDGTLAISLTGSEHHLSGGVLLAAATTRRTLGSVFPEQLIVPGERMFFLAAKRRGVLSADWLAPAERLEERGIRTSFVNEAWLQDALQPFRRELILEAIRDEPEPRLNTDLHPVSYYHQTRIWLDQLASPLARPLRLLAPLRVWWAAAPLAAAALFVAITRGRSRRMGRGAVLIAAAAIGGFGLLVEVLALLAFQSACGYLYHALGALIAASMAGLAIGAAIMSRWEADRRSAARILLAGLAVAALVCGLLPKLLAAVLPAPTLAPAALALLLILVGSMVGALFPVATALYRAGQPAAAAAGAVYAADLIGSAGAALIAGVVTVPLLGAPGASYAGGLVVASALVLALPLLRE